MSRRFVNLVVNKLSGGRPTFNLHRINLATLFCPTGSPKTADPAAIKKAPAPRTAPAPAPARLPSAALSFYPRNGWMDFIAFNDDVIAVDPEGRTLLYDSGVGAVRVMNPILNHPKRTSISLTLGGDLYVMARHLSVAQQVYHSQVLSMEDWFWYPLKELPFYDVDIIKDPNYNEYKLILEQLDPFELGAYTAVGDSEIWISTVGVGTYSFHIENGTWSKIGDWALPFSGCAHYVAEHGLWFGFSEKDQQLCAANLRQQPPALPLRKFPLLHLWEEEPPAPETWIPTATRLFPMGSGKFCIVRCFRTTEHEKAKSFALLAGVEVVEDAGTGSLQIVKHNSVCYSVGENMVRPL